jgi:hypothetical protein
MGKMPRFHADCLVGEAFYEVVIEDVAIAASVP